MKLKRKFVKKPWGRSDLPAIFGRKRKYKIGEVWFEPPQGIYPALMIKYLFTSEKLSIQVHPNDRQARRRDLPHGKEECWYILSAEPDAKLGIGLTKSVSATKLRAAVACDQLEKLVDWKPVKAGDLFYIPAGTIHAIGPGISLVEVQQNIDITYRLYDYGRSRELHLDDAISAARPEPYDLKKHQHIEPDLSQMLIDGPHFRLYQIVGDDPEMLSSQKASEWQIIPLEGSATVRDKSISAGECGLCANISDVDLSKNDRALVACTMK